MSNKRVILWLTVVSVLSLIVNAILAWRTPVDPKRMSRFMLEPAFNATTVSIIRPDKPATVVKKRDGRWTMTEPFAATIDEQPIARLLDEVTFTPVDDSISESEIVSTGRSRGDFGLKNPELKVVFSNDAKREVTISFGHETALTNGVYVTRGETDPICVMPQSVRAAADLHPETLRERAIFPYTPEFITAFDIKPIDNPRLSFTRTEKGWKLGDEAAALARVENFLNILTEANAIDFIWTGTGETGVPIAPTPILEGHGLDIDSALVITLHCQDGNDRRILLGNDTSTSKNYALVHNGGAVVTIPPELKFAALGGAEAFTDSRLFPVDEIAVRSYAISDGVVSYVVARDLDGRWRLDSPVSAPADPEVAAMMLRRLLALTPADFDTKGLKVSVSTGAQSHSVSPYSVVGRGRLDDLRSREILKIDPSLVRRLVSTSSGAISSSSVSVVRRQDKRSWSVESDDFAYQPVREDVVDDILEALKTLTAARVVVLRPTTADLSRFGLEDPIHTLAVDQEKDDQVRRNILIGNPAPGGRYVTVGSSDAVFVLPGHVTDILMSPLVEEKR